KRSLLWRCKSGLLRPARRSPWFCPTPCKIAAATARTGRIKLRRTLRKKKRTSTAGHADTAAQQRGHELRLRGSPHEAPGTSLSSAHRGYPRRPPPQRFPATIATPPRTRGARQRREPVERTHPSRLHRRRRGRLAEAAVAHAAALASRLPQPSLASPCPWPSLAPRLGRGAQPSHRPLG